MINIEKLIEDLTKILIQDRENHTQCHRIFEYINIINMYAALYFKDYGRNRMEASLDWLQLMLNKMKALAIALKQINSNNNQTGFFQVESIKNNKLALERLQLNLTKLNIIFKQILIKIKN